MSTTDVEDENPHEGGTRQNEEEDEEYDDTESDSSTDWDNEENSPENGRDERTMRNAIRIFLESGGLEEMGVISMSREAEGGSSSSSRTSQILRLIPRQRAGASWHSVRQRKNVPPDLSVINRNDIKTILSNDMGSVPPHGFSRGMKDAPKTMLERMTERAQGNRFTSGVKRRMGSNYLPMYSDELARFRQKAFCGIYGRDGDIFLSACQDTFLRIYDTSQGAFNLLQTIRAKNVGWSVLDVDLSPDGRSIVYASWSDCLYETKILCDDVDEKHTVMPLSQHHRQFCIFSVVYSQDSQELLGGANDGEIYLYDRLSQSQTLAIQAHSQEDVNAVCFMDNTSHILASGADDGLCKVWDRRSLRESSPQPVGVFAGHVNGLTFLDSKGDSRYLISNSKDQSIKLWDLRVFSSPDTVAEGQRATQTHQDWDYRWESAPRSRNRAHLDGDSSVMTYTGHTVLKTLIRARFSPAFSTGQKYIYCGSADENIYIYDVLTGKNVKTLESHRGCVRDVNWHPYMPDLISSSFDHSVVRWTPENKRLPPKRKRSHPGPEYELL